MSVCALSVCLSVCNWPLAVKAQQWHTSRTVQHSVTVWKFSSCPTTGTTTNQNTTGLSVWGLSSRHDLWLVSEPLSVDPTLVVVIHIRVIQQFIVWWSFCSCCWHWLPAFTPLSTVCSTHIGNSSLVQSGTSPNSVRVRNKVRVSDRVTDKNKLLLWLWQTLVMAASGYGGPSYSQFWTSDNQSPHTFTVKPSLMWQTDISVS